MMEDNKSSLECTSNIISQFLQIAQYNNVSDEPKVFPKTRNTNTKIEENQSYQPFLTQQKSITPKPQSDHFVSNNQQKDDPIKQIGRERRQRTSKKFEDEVPFIQTDRKQEKKTVKEKPSQPKSAPQKPQKNPKKIQKRRKHKNLESPTETEDEKKKVTKLSNQQLDEFIKMYKNHTNKHLLKHFGISRHLLFKYKSQFNLVKDLTFIQKKIQNKNKKHNSDDDDNDEIVEENVACRSQNENSIDEENDHSEFLDMKNEEGGNTEDEELNTIDEEESSGDNLKHNTPFQLSYQGTNTEEDNLISLQNDHTHQSTTHPLLLCSNEKTFKSDEKTKNKHQFQQFQFTNNKMNNMNIKQEFDLNQQMNSISAQKQASFRFIQANMNV